MKTLTTKSESQSEQVLAKVIVLGLDVHADSIRVVRARERVDRLVFRSTASRRRLQDF